MQSRSPAVAIIILNWNNARDTLECLASVQRLDYRNFSVIVVDNGSTNESVTTIRARFPAVAVIENSANLGFAAGNNRGIEYACKGGFEWLLLLNPDTTVGSNALSEMLRSAEGDPAVGILGPMIYHADEPATIQSAGGTLDALWIPTHREQNTLDQGQHTDPADVDWVSGSAMLVNAKLVADIGALDERFFMYEEELDWCIRAQRAGWRIVHVPQAKVWHKGAQRDHSPKLAVTYYMARNHLLLLSKHHAGLVPMLHTQFQVLRTLTSWSIRSRWRHKTRERDELAHAWVDFIKGRFGQAEGL